MTTMPAPVAHRTIETDGVEIFYREAGPADAPVVLLPHGYPCSSFEFGLHDHGSQSSSGACTPEAGPLIPAAPEWTGPAGGGRGS